MIEINKTNIFLKLMKSIKKVYIWCLRYKNQRILYVIIFLFLFIKSLNILDISSSNDSNLIRFYKSKSDFEDYYNAGIELKAKRNPYYLEKIENLKKNILNEIESKQDALLILDSIRGIGTFLYPPFFAFLIIPWTAFSYNIAGFFFQMFQLLLFFLSMKLLYKTVKYIPLEISNRKIHFAILISTLSFLPFLAQNISNGNIGFLLIFFISISIYFFFWNQKKIHIWEIGNGMIIGISAIIKILPGFLGSLFFTKRRFLVLIGILLGIALGIFIPSLYLGWDLNLEYFRSWYEVIIKPYQKYSIIRPYANNQTISSAFSKLFIPYSDFKQFQYGLPLTGISVPLEYIIIIIRFINMVLLGNLLIITLLLAFIKNYKETIFIYYLYLLFLTALLTSGISWYHSYSILMIVYFFAFLYYFKKFKINISIFIFPTIYIWFYTFLSYKYKDILSLYSIYTWMQIMIVIWLYVYIYSYILKFLKQKIYET